MNRRTFIRSSLAAGAALAAPGCLAPFREPAARKLVVVLFGGGTRSSESLGDPEHRFVPFLGKELAPQGTLFTNLRVEHKVVHPNSAGSIVTGHWEWDDLDWSKPVRHPTIFESFRRDRAAADTSAWAFVYASILSKAALSAAEGFGEPYAANVVEPPTIARGTAEAMDNLMRDAAATGSTERQRQATEQCACLAREQSRIASGGWRSPAAIRFMEQQYEQWKGQSGSTSHDAFLADCATACMRKFAPEVLWVAFGEIDCAHYGSWSRYTEAIRRTDALTAQIWRTAQELPAYRGRTLLLVLPDHGRELDRQGGSGFIHHSDFYTDTGSDEGCRRVWMLAAGPGVAAQHSVERPVPITAVAATGLEFLGLRAPAGAERSVLEMCT